MSLSFPPVSDGDSDKKMLGLICFAILFLLKNKNRNPADRFRAHFAAVKSGDCSTNIPSHFVLFSYDFYDLCLHLPKKDSRTPNTEKQS